MDLIPVISSGMGYLFVLLWTSMLNGIFLQIGGHA